MSVLIPPPVPTGTLHAFAGSTAPAGYLLCDGAPVSRSTYAALFSVISTTYGSGDGSTTFNLPDLRGRVPAGADNMGGTAASRLTSASGGVDGATLGAAGGSQAHTLTTAQMPVHNHAYSDPGHFHSVLSYGGGGGPDTVANWTVGGASYAGSSTFGTSGRGYTGISISNAGSGQAHPNVPPTIVLNYLIKT